MRVVFVPIDNRPVCYDIPEMIAGINGDIDLLLPPIEFLGGLETYANISRLFEWLKSTIRSADAVILSLDTIAYGGLISSRRCPETFEQIEERLINLKEILKTCKGKIYAFSSVMRISNNNVNQEEKEYWNLYGEKIFNYSHETDKYGKSETDVPDDIIEDYLNTRKRNFEINKIYLNWQKEGIFDTLIFSKDDCAEFGLNVKEARELESLGGFTKTGADEIPLTLFARAISTKVKVCPKFIEPEYKNLISCYEDVSIENSVKGQLELAGCEITNESDADVILYVNNFKKQQGEIVMKRETELFDGKWKQPKKPYIIADVRNANGADNNFVKEFFKFDLNDKFLGYSAWNTSANTLGSLICEMKIVLDAKNKGKYNINDFKKYTVVRFLDDWAYQANVRQQLLSLNTSEISDKMKSFEVEVKRYLGVDFGTSYSFPWNRLFEVRIELN